MNVIAKAFEGQPVRIIVENGKTWFVGRDVCELLGYKNHRKAIMDHCKGAPRRYALSTEGGVQEFRVIREPDVMRLVCSSKLPDAERFAKWIFEGAGMAKVQDGKQTIPAVADAQIEALSAAIEEERHKRTLAEEKTKKLEAMLAELTKEKKQQTSRVVQEPRQSGKYIKLLVPAAQLDKLIEHGCIPVGVVAFE